MSGSPNGNHRYIHQRCQMHISRVHRQHHIQMTHQIQFRTHIQFTDHGNHRRIFGNPGVKDFLFAFPTAKQKNFHRRISSKMSNNLFLQF